MYCWPLSILHVALDKLSNKQQVIWMIMSMMIMIMIMMMVYYRKSFFGHFLFYRYSVQVLFASGKLHSSVQVRFASGKVHSKAKSPAFNVHSSSRSGKSA
jgi:hypothetical protein